MARHFCICHLPCSLELILQFAGGQKLTRRKILSQRPRMVRIMSPPGPLCSLTSQLRTIALWETFRSFSFIYLRVIVQASWLQTTHVVHVLTLLVNFEQSIWMFTLYHAQRIMQLVLCKSPVGSEVLTHLSGSQALLTGTEPLCYRGPALATVEINTGDSKLLQLSC
jgi:hypothetical protein